MTTLTSNAPIFVVGGGIGGLAAALTIAREGCHVKVLEQARAIGEIGACIQLGPNAFATLDTLGVGESARGYAVCAQRLVMIDAVDGEQVVDLPVGEAFRNRFGNPYAVIHRRDVQSTLLQGVQATDRIEFLTSARIVTIAETTSGVTATEADGKTYGGSALIGRGGVKSMVRQQLIGDPPRLSGDVVYPTLLAADDFPGELRLNAPVLWVGPDCHIVH